MFFEEYYNGKVWGVRSITNEDGTEWEEKHIAHYGKGIDNHDKALLKARELNGLDAKRVTQQYIR